MRSLAGAVLFGLTLFASGLVAATSRAQETAPGDTPFLMRANEIRYDRELGVVTATGDVEISQGARILRADTVAYNERTDSVGANGNVVLLEPSGDVVFAEYAELTGDLRTGFIRDIRIRLADESRFAAVDARRFDGARTEMQKAVYSPCQLCPDHPKRPPLWQIKAVRVIHDQANRNIEYRDAVLEVFGFPVAYTPYFAHPDPTVERRSGLLFPGYGNSSDLGVTLRLPYYFDIAPHRDATFSPLLTSNEGVVLAGEYRHRLDKGLFEISGSVTGTALGASESPEGDSIRGHVDARIRADIDDRWRAGADLKRTTDDTYMRR